MSRAGRTRQTQHLPRQSVRYRPSSSQLLFSQGTRIALDSSGESIDSKTPAQAFSNIDIVSGRFAQRYEATKDRVARTLPPHLGVLVPSCKPLPRAHMSATQENEKSQPSRMALRKRFVLSSAISTFFAAAARPGSTPMPPCQRARQRKRASGHAHAR